MSRDVNSIQKNVLSLLRCATSVAIKWRQIIPQPLLLQMCAGTTLLVAAPAMLHQVGERKYVGGSLWVARFYPQHGLSCAWSMRITNRMSSALDPSSTCPLRPLFCTTARHHADPTAVAQGASHVHGEFSYGVLHVLIPGGSRVFREFSRALVFSLPPTHVCYRV